MRPRRFTTKAVLVRMDIDLFRAVESASIKSFQSRENFIRRVLAEKVGEKSKIYGHLVNYSKRKTVANK